MNPYVVIGTPNYSAPMVDLFGNNSSNNKSGQQGMSFTDALQKFLNGQYGQQMLAPGSAVPGSVGPTSVGGANGPMPLVGSMY